ncbi:MAG: lipopolysaccharide kinase InaA family protein [Planctomycetota bacterium]
MKNEKYNNLKDYVTVCEGGWTGYVHADFQHVPLSSLIDPTVSDEQRGPFEKVHSSDMAEVYRYSFKTQETSGLLYLKKHHHRSMLDAVKHLFRPSRAKRAFDAGLMLKKHGLNAPQNIAFLQKKEGPLSAEDILITQEIANATPLSTVLRSNETNLGPMTGNNKRKMIAELGTAIGQMHKAGISHGDLRTGNVFVRQESSRWRFIFIDNERTVKHVVLPVWLRLKNLVQLNMQQVNVSATDRMRFLQAYRQAADIGRLRSKRIARTVAKRTVQRFKQRTKSRIGLSGTDPQTHWNCQTARANRYSGIFLTDFAKSDTAAQLFGQIEDLTKTGTVLKDDVSTRVVRSMYNGWDIVIKRYNYQGFWHSLRHTIKGSRAKKCWRFGHLLTAVGIPCAAAIGVVEERRFGMIHQSYIINAFVAGPLLHALMNDPDCSPQEQRSIVQKAEGVLEQLGRHRLTHSDMKSSNMIISGGAPVLIDLDSMRQHRQGPYFRNRYKKMLQTFHQRLYGKK